MKTLPFLATAAALVAGTILPFALEVVATLAFAGGVLALLAADYARPSQLPLNITQRRPARRRQVRATESHRLAA
jgi:hypothetical protein